ncbi:Uncharacterized protein APZ42_003361, partial [Daphnia magna]
GWDEIQVGRDPGRPSSRWAETQQTSVSWQLSVKNGPRSDWAEIQIGGPRSGWAEIQSGGPRSDWAEIQSGGPRSDWAEIQSGGPRYFKGHSHTSVSELFSQFGWWP